MTTSPVLSIALEETTRPPLRPLPVEAAELLHDVDAPPRLVAHLRAVHDVAAQLLLWIDGRGLDLDDVLTRIGDGADGRLAFQMPYSPGGDGP